MGTNDNKIDDSVNTLDDLTKVLIRIFWRIFKKYIVVIEFQILPNFVTVFNLCNMFMIAPNRNIPWPKTHLRISLPCVIQRIHQGIAYITALGNR